MEPELVERYVNDGTLRIEWRDFAYLKGDSVAAAEAARAAQEQGKFWEYHDLLYENQGGEFSDEELIGFAEELGLDVPRFESGLTSNRYEDVVRADLREAQSAGIQGTPSFEVNGQRLTGPQPLESFEQVIQQELEGA